PRSVYSPDDAFTVPAMLLALLKCQAKRLEPFRTARLRPPPPPPRCPPAALACAGAARCCNWRPALSWGRTLCIGESFVRYAIFIGVTQNHDCILRWLRYKEVAVRRKFHQSGAGNIVSI